jgi:hypothetical protein
VLRGRRGCHYLELHGQRLPVKRQLVLHILKQRLLGGLGGGADSRQSAGG